VKGSLDNGGGKSPRSFCGVRRSSVSQTGRSGISRGRAEGEVRVLRLEKGIRSVFKLVDTCAAEFEAYTPYYYSTYEQEDESRVSDRKKIMILGGGPNRIGQGIEFDYCCVHAAFARERAWI